MFLHLSVILFTGREVSRPTPGGVGGLAGWGLQAHIPGEGSRPTPEGDVSRPRLGGGRLLLRAVRILLECIPVHLIFKQFHKCRTLFYFEKCNFGALAALCRLIVDNKCMHRILLFDIS